MTSTQKMRTSIRYVERDFSLSFYLPYLLMTFNNVGARFTPARDMPRGRCPRDFTALCPPLARQICALARTPRAPPHGRADVRARLLAARDVIKTGDSIAVGSDAIARAQKNIRSNFS